MNVLTIMHSAISPKFRCRDAHRKFRVGKRQLVIGFVAVLYSLSGFPSVWANQDDGPRELPKPKIKTTEPLFKDWNFDKEPTGSPPGGFVSGSANGVKDGQWVVADEPSAPSQARAVLQHSDCADASCYQVLLDDNTEVTYVDVSVQMKPMAGQSSGKAGVVLAAKDHKNFYAAVITPEANTVEALLVRDGKATVFGQQPITLEEGGWASLRVQRSPMMSHDLFNVFVNQRMLLSLSDSTLKEGKVGLITWGRGAFAFDNFRAQEALTNLPISRPPAY
ncbi:MAG: hypothetical protein NPIRA02_05360 [Nitrospirales bacterium]|nr:MAG: hypothetical protein NPIRA02_05360 [Nitrospirales bacterium]